MILSAAAGGLGALAGAVGKLSLSHDSVTALAVTSLCYRAMRTAPSDINSICLGFGHASRFLGLAAMLSLNALMVKLFLQALTAKRSTAAVTLISTATNFAITGVLGSVLLGEELSLRWLLGFCMIVGGIFLLQNSTLMMQRKYVPTPSDLALRASNLKKASRFFVVEVEQPMLTRERTCSMRSSVSSTSSGSFSIEPIDSNNRLLRPTFNQQLRRQDSIDRKYGSNEGLSRELSSRSRSVTWNNGRESAVKASTSADDESPFGALAKVSSLSDYVGNVNKSRSSSLR